MCITHIEKGKTWFKWGRVNTFFVLTIKVTQRNYWTEYISNVVCYIVQPCL